MIRWQREIFILFLILVPSASHAAYGDVRTLFGSIVGPNGEGQDTVQWDQPSDMVLGSDGSWYVADTSNHVVRVINSSGKVSTVAGTGANGFVNGATGSALFSDPRGIVRASDGALYVTDRKNDVVRKIVGGSVSTVSSGFKAPHGLAISGSTLYITDLEDGTIVKMNTDGSSKITLTSGLSSPTKIVLSGSNLYVAETGKYRVIRVDASSGAVTVVAGSGEKGFEEGVGTLAGFANIGGLALSGSNLYVADAEGFFDHLSVINLNTGQVDLVLDDPTMLYLNNVGDLEMSGNKVRVLNSGSSQIFEIDPNDPENPTFISGHDRFGNLNGAFSVARLGRPKAMVSHPTQNILYVAENNKIREVDLGAQQVREFIGNSVDNFQEGRTGSSARFSDITSLAINSAGTTLYLTDRNNHRVRGVDMATKTDFLISGAGRINDDGATPNADADGTKCLNEFNVGVSGCAYFDNPMGLVLSLDEQYLYVADTANNRIRKVTISSGDTARVAGTGGAGGYVDGTGSSAKFSRPVGMALDSTGRWLYVADSSNHVIRKIDLSNNTVSTLAGAGRAGYQDGTGTTSYFNIPEYLTLWGKNLFVSENGGQRIRVIDTATGLVKTVAGSGSESYKNAQGTSASFQGPKGLWVDTDNAELYVADNGNDVLRVIDIAGEAPFVEPAPVVTGTSPHKLEKWGYGPETRMISVVGKNFRHGAKVWFGNLPVVKAYVGDESIAVEIPIKNMPPGYYDVQVQNADTQVAILAKGFEITSGGVTPSTQYLAPGPNAPTTARAAERSWFTDSGSTPANWNMAAGNAIDGGGEEVVFGAGSGSDPTVRVFSLDGRLQKSFLAYTSGMRSGVRVAVCARGGEIVTVPGSGSAAHVRRFSGTGKLLSGGFFAWEPTYRGGAFIACGDVNGDGNDDIVLGTDQGGPRVSAYSKDGKLIASFLAYASTFRGGVRVAVGDFSGDGKAEMITMPARGGSAHVRTFKIALGKVEPWSVGFHALKSFLGEGAYLAARDLTGDGKSEIITGTGVGSYRPLVEVWTDRGVQLDQFLAYDPNFRGGVMVAAGKQDGRSKPQIITAPVGSGRPHVRVFPEL